MNRKQILDKIKLIHNTVWDGDKLMTVHKKIKLISELRAQLREMDNE